MYVGCGERGSERRMCVTIIYIYIGKGRSNSSACKCGCQTDGHLSFGHRSFAVPKWWWVWCSVQLLECVKVLKGCTAVDMTRKGVRVILGRGGV